MDEANKKAATLPAGIMGPPGSPPMWGAGIPPGRTSHTMPRPMSSPGAIDPYAIRPLPSLPKSRHTPPPGLPRIKEIYNNPVDLAPVTGSSTPQMAPPPPVSTSQEIIEEIRQEEKNKNILAPPDSDDKTCHSISVEDDTDAGYRNTSLPDEEQEPPYKNVAGWTYSTESGYEQPAELREMISRLPAADHPKPPTEAPETDETGSISDDLEPDTETSLFPEAEHHPPYANAINPNKAIPRPPSVASSGGYDTEPKFENPEVLDDFVDEDFDGVKLTDAVEVTENEMFL